jgi:hypothetical protein
MRGKHAIEPQPGLVSADRDGLGGIISHGSNNVR